MLPIPTLRILLTIPIVLFGLCFLALSATILIRQKPVLLSGSVLAWVVTSAFGVIIISVVIIMTSASEGSVTCLGLAESLVLLGLILVIHRKVRGYYLAGITETAFRSSLRTALGELGYAFEETITGFHLPSLMDRLRTNISPRLGMAGFSMEDQGHSSELAAIARQVRGYLRQSYASESFSSALIYGALGLAFMVLALYQWGRLQP